MNKTKTITARASFVRLSPRKLREVADSVRGISPAKAVDQLKLLPKRAARTLLDVFQQALGNAKNNFKISPETLTVKTITIQDGPRSKRRDAHAHGARFDAGTRKKKTSHVTVVLEAKE